MVETIQSLVVAFVLAMTFRGFVTEGFVIPTGSMAPTLKGQHLLMRSEETGSVFAVGLDLQDTPPRIQRIADPMIGPTATGFLGPEGGMHRRMGDRILVLKCIYPFADPDRYDIVVFKNPTNPNGEAGNYIKRLVGLPNEKIWLADGDVFAGPAADPDRADDYAIQRKPEHVQRAVWQPVYHSDFTPVHPDDDRLARSWQGAPWRGDGWEAERGTYRTFEDGPTMLAWSGREVSDWTPYNMLTAGTGRQHYPLSDVRVAAAITPAADGLVTRYELEAREHVFTFTVDTVAATATVAMRPLEGDDPPVERTVSIDRPRAGRVFNVEFWHVDQALAIFLDGRRVVDLTYDWKPADRIEHAVGASLDRWRLRFPFLRANAPMMRWHFEGSPAELHRIRVDRDLFYLPARLKPRPQVNRPVIEGPAFGTHPDHPAVLGPDQFFMLGDNSPASSDSRLWGRPHPVVAHQIDPAPFVVNRKLLLGKAWVVYFPAPYAFSDRGVSVIPDFGRLRFIR
ncbi:MAG: S26 family signal peptidase [Planctomycetota bacterium]|jgi:signal peptidase I